MQTEWDYTKLAASYDKRADYCLELIDMCLGYINLPKGTPVADIGAGTGKLTKLLIPREYNLQAIEPNDQMRAIGMKNTATQAVKWSEGTGENTGLPPHSQNLVTFGSSFNVTDRAKTIVEVKRILKEKGWFMCMWNHRDLEDPLQAQIEAIISRYSKNYDYGTRREDQTNLLKNSGLFSTIMKLEGHFKTKFSVADYIEAWRSHATLERQTGANFASVITNMEDLLKTDSEIEVPYTTRLWLAQLK